MESEHFRIFIQRKALKVLVHLFESAFGRSVIHLKLGQLVVVVHNFRAEVLAEHGVHGTDITVISDTSSVVDLSHDVVKGDVWYLRLLSQEEE